MIRCGWKSFPMRVKGSNAPCEKFPNRNTSRWIPMNRPRTKLEMKEKCRARPVPRKVYPVKQPGNQPGGDSERYIDSESALGVRAAIYRNFSIYLLSIRRLIFKRGLVSKELTDFTSLRLPLDSA